MARSDEAGVDVQAVLTGSWRMLATAWRLDRRKTALSIVLVIAGAAAAPLLAAATKWLTDAVVAGQAALAVQASAALALLAVVGLTAGHFGHVFYFELAELAELDFDRQLATLSNGSPGIEHHERAEQADALTVLQREGRRFRMGLEALMQCLALALAMMLTAVLVAMLDPILLLLPLAALPPLLAGRAAERYLDRARTAVAEPTRVAFNLFHLSTSARAAGELRTFRLQDTVLARHARLWEEATRGLWQAHLRGTALRAAGQLVFALAYVGAVLLVVRNAIAGRSSVGDVVLVIVLAAQVNQQVIAAVSLLQNLQRMGSAYRRLREFRAFVTGGEQSPADRSLPPQLQQGITFRDVSFSYPGTQEPVVQDVNLDLPAGSMVAIVGENGAGKTTLVKLLCGFYQPTQGAVLVDGVDLSRVPTEQWRERIAAGFQDFVRYELPAQQAVGVGDLPRIESRSAVRAALDRAHAADVLERLPAGLDTQLGKSYAEGVELSGGQWQKVALGRAMMRESPLLLVLDEPTAALDPEAEHALFERYTHQARSVGQATGAVTLFVSHRFSTVRMADIIVVVREGRVTEVGSHAALVAAGGLYAELFALQERAYG